MLIIFGTKVRTKVLRALVFACPNCRTDRRGVVLLLRRWFTLFFIPIVPMAKIGEAVRCETCKGTFRTDVLGRPTAAETGEANTNAVRALSVLVVGAGDRADAGLRAHAVATVASLVPGYGDDTLTTDLPAIDPAHAAQYVRPLAESFDPGRSERFLADLVRIAAAGDEITPAQQALFDEVGRALGLSPAHIAGVVATATTGTGPGPTTGATWPPRHAGATWPPRPAPAADPGQEG
ncbi:MAG: zinc-ribbon domain-containing protein [Acidimicrobiales bacterium]|nr:zinc-ribbon domain-containing protein [Acidimicrobiales bacterium]